MMKNAEILSMPVSNSLSWRDALNNVEKYSKTGDFLKDLASLVAIPTESQISGNNAVLHSYLKQHISRHLGSIEFTTKIYKNPESQGGPLSILT